MDITSPHSSWIMEKDQDKPESKKANELAYQALIEFREQFAQLKPDTVYQVSYNHGHYINNLLYVRREFERQNYTNVCNEISKLLFQNKATFLQPRIYYNILKILDEYL